jgi:hypothetical protein
MPLAISNFDESKKRIEAKSNLDNYVRFYNGFIEIGDRMKVLTNLEFMEQELNKLIAEGRINEGDTKYRVLKGYIDEASKYLMVRDPSVDDVHNHYSVFRDFYNMVSGIRGGGGRV